MRRGWKLLTVGLAFAGLTALAAPAHATEAGLPLESVIRIKPNGKSEVVKTFRDHSKSRYASVRAKAMKEPCHAGWICLYEDEKANGSMGYLEDPSQYIDDLSIVDCDTCGPNKRGESGNFNDQMSSFINRSGRMWWWYYHANGHLPRHNMNRTDPIDGFTPPYEEWDEATAVYVG